MITEDTTLAELAIELQRYRVRVSVDLKPSRHFEVRLVDHDGTTASAIDPVLWRAFERALAVLDGFLLRADPDRVQFTVVARPDVIGYAPGKIPCTCAGGVLGDDGQRHHLRGCAALDLAADGDWEERDWEERP